MSALQQTLLLDSHSLKARISDWSLRTPGMSSYFPPKFLDKVTDDQLSLLGKSTGKGSLSLWMHNLKSITFKNYSSQAYKGPSAKIAAGVQAYEAYAAANALGVTIVGGDCPTVGLAGGYYPGGGHGPFSSKYGLASDQILEWEAVVANGSHIVATPTQNSDLYWALSGGGAGTFAVALSVTVKTHPDGTFGGAALSFTSVGISQDTYWELIEVWHSEVLPHVVDAGGQIIYVMTAGYFAVAPLNLPGATSGQVSSLLEPLTSKLAQYNITFNLVVTLSSSFLEHRAIYAAPLPYGSYTINNTVGSRLIPRSLVENPSSRTSLMNAFRNVTASGEFGIGGIGVNVNHTVAGNQVSSNAVLPAWRETLIHAIIEGPWDLEASQAGNMETVSLITNDWVPQLEHLTPGSGTYLNEADYQLTTWKEDFYGANYERLVTIKLKYDPYNVLYAHTAVGSDFWSVASDGRLCRAS